MSRIDKITEFRITADQLPPIPRKTHKVALLSICNEACGGGSGLVFALRGEVDRNVRDLLTEGMRFLRRVTLDATLCTKGIDVSSIRWGEYVEHRYQPLRVVEVAQEVWTKEGSTEALPKAEVFRKMRRDAKELEAGFSRILQGRITRPEEIAGIAARYRSLEVPYLRAAAII